MEVASGPGRAKNCIMRPPSHLRLVPPDRLSRQLLQHREDPRGRQRLWAAAEALVVQHHPLVVVRDTKGRWEGGRGGRQQLDRIQVDLI